MKKLIPLVVIFFALSCTKGGTPDIKVWAPKVAGTGDIAVFLLIFNNGKGADSLTGCSVPIFPEAKCEIDDIVGGMMKKVDEIEIPAGDVVALERSGFHIMVFGMPDRLPEKFGLDLRFKKSGTKSIDVVL